MPSSNSHISDAVRADLGKLDQSHRAGNPSGREHVRWLVGSRRKYPRQRYRHGQKNWAKPKGLPTLPRAATAMIAPE